MHECRNRLLCTAPAIKHTINDSESTTDAIGCANVEIDSVYICMLYKANLINYRNRNSSDEFERTNDTIACPNVQIACSKHLSELDVLLMILEAQLTN